MNPTHTSTRKPAPMPDDLHIVLPKRNPTRPVHVRDTQIGGGAPIALQSMAATRTQDIHATVRQVQLLHHAGAHLIRIAVDSRKDVHALQQIRQQTTAPLSVDLQENYRLAPLVAPHVDKIRYNPGHLHHHETHKTIADKVALIAHTAAQHNLAIRIGVNCGSIDPRMLQRYPNDHNQAIVASALEHCQLLDNLQFHNYLVSLKDSDWKKVVQINTQFAQERPDIPLHLGVTEAGLPPDGVIKTRLAFEQLLPQGIGDTLRVSLTLPFDRKDQEIHTARDILQDIAQGRFRSVPKHFDTGLNIISCPSCSRVENEKFIDLAQDVKQLTAYAAQHHLTIAVMGCRVNGPGETDDADLGLWCGPAAVNLKRGQTSLGHFPYDQILPKLKQELDQIIAARDSA